MEGTHARRAVPSRGRSGARGVLALGTLAPGCAFARSTRIKGRATMAEDETPLHGRQRVLRRLQEEARIKGGNDTIVRLCIVGFGIAIASLAPVTWGWKIALFLVIMLLVGIIIPAIWRARQKSKISH